LSAAADAWDVELLAADQPTDALALTTDAGEPVALDPRQAIALYRVSKLVTASLDLDATLEAVVQAAHELTGAHATALALLDYESNLVLQVARGPVTASIGEYLPLDRGITGQAFREGRPILVPDMAQDARRARPDLDDRYGVRCFVAVPLNWQAERLGVVTLAFTEPHALGDSDLALTCALAEQAAAAVAHARDYAEEQRLRAESEEIMRQFVEQSQQLDRVQRQLIQNEKLTAIGQLIQGLAHEMNTPLSVVIANLSVLGRYAEALADVARAAQHVLPQLQADPLAAALVAPLDEAVQGADLEYVLDDLPALVEESAAGARRVADLVRSVGTFARRDTNGPQPLAINEVLEAALNLASNELKHRASVEHDYADDVPPVLGLASELTQVFVHLLINAAQALQDAPGRVTVGVARTGDEVTVTVTDTGRGIVPEHLERVFEPFFTTRAPGEGTGMGLAVCYGIIQRHGGWIGIDSHLGQGTRVTVRLPIAETAPREQAA